MSATTSGRQRPRPLRHRLSTAQEVLDLDRDLSQIPTAMVGVIVAHPHGSVRLRDAHLRPRRGGPRGPRRRRRERLGWTVATRTAVVSGSYHVSQGRRLGRVVVPPGPQAAGGRSCTVRDSRLGTWQIRTLATWEGELTLCLPPRGPSTLVSTVVMDHGSARPAWSAVTATLPDGR